MTRPASAECRKSLIGRSALNDVELRRMAVDMWHRKGVAMIDPEDIPNEFDRQRITNTANQLYGKRATE